MSAGAGWQDYKPTGDEGWQDTGPSRPDLSKNPPAIAGPHVDMKPLPQGILGRLESGPEDVPAMPNRVPQSIMHAPDELGEAVGGTAIGGSALMGAGAAAPFVARTAAKHPIATAMLASEGIRGARQLPVIGKMIPPYSEMLPFFMGGGKGGPIGEAGEAGEAAEASGTSIAAPSTPAIKGRLVLSPEEAQAQEHMQKLAKTRASQRGMQYAGGMRPAD